MVESVAAATGSQPEQAQDEEGFVDDEPLPGPKLQVKVKHIYPEKRPFGVPVVRDEDQRDASSDSDAEESKVSEGAAQAKPAIPINVQHILPDSRPFGVPIVDDQGQLVNQA